MATRYGPCRRESRATRSKIERTADLKRLGRPRPARRRPSASGRRASRPPAGSRCSSPERPRRVGHPPLALERHESPSRFRSWSTHQARTSSPSTGTRSEDRCRTYARRRQPRRGSRRTTTRRSGTCRRSRRRSCRRCFARPGSRGSFSFRGSAPSAGVVESRTRRRRAGGGDRLDLIASNHSSRASASARSRISQTAGSASVVVAATAVQRDGSIASSIGIRRSQSYVPRVLQSGGLNCV